MPELLEILNTSREKQHQNNKFFAALKGINLDEGSDRGQKEWDDMKARVFSGGRATDSRDITSLQGINAAQAGFGIGMGLDYVDIRNEPVNPMS
jgi:hypothetical protein